MDPDRSKETSLPRRSSVGRPNSRYPPGATGETLLLRDFPQGHSFPSRPKETPRYSYGVSQEVYPPEGASAPPVEHRIFSGWSLPVLLNIFRNVSLPASSYFFSLLLGISLFLFLNCSSISNPIQGSFSVELFVSPIPYQFRIFNYILSRKMFLR